MTTIRFNARLASIGLAAALAVSAIPAMADVMVGGAAHAAHQGHH